MQAHRLATPNVPTVVRSGSTPARAAVAMIIDNGPERKEGNGRPLIPARVTHYAPLQVRKDGVLLSDAASDGRAPCAKLKHRIT